MKKIALIMGSKNDYSHLENIPKTLDEFGCKYDVLIVSAHRTPDWMAEFAKDAINKYDVIIAAAGGSAHLPGMVSSYTTLPVIAVPITSSAFNGIDAVLSMIQMPNGTPIATMGIDRPINAALMAIRILAINDKKLEKHLLDYKHKMCSDVLNNKVIKSK